MAKRSKDNRSSSGQNASGRPPHDGEESAVAAPYAGVGARLREARQRAGLDMADIASRLRIKERHIAAIENGTFDQAPGRIYVMGFVRNYADLVGVDAAEMITLFKRETGHLSTPGRLEFPTPDPENRMPRMGLVVGALILGAVAYAGWYYLNDIRRLTTGVVGEVPERMQASEQKSPTAATGTSSDASDTPAAPAPNQMTGSTNADSPPPASETPADPTPGTAAPVETPATPPATASNPPLRNPPQPPAQAPTPAPTQATTQATNQAPNQTPNQTPGIAEAARKPVAATPALSPDKPLQTATATPPATTPPPVVTPPAATPMATAPQPTVATPAAPPAVPTSQPAASSTEPQVFGVANTDARVVIRARFDSWVQVRGPEEEVLLTRIMRPGDTYLVPNRPNLRLYASDAGALEIMVDGKSLPAIGAAGEVLRDVSLEAAALANGTARRGG